MSSVRERKYAAGTFWEGWYQDKNGKWRGFNTEIAVAGKASKKAALEFTAWKERETRSETAEAASPGLTVAQWRDEYLTEMAPSWARATLVSRSDTLRRLTAICGDRPMDDVADAVAELRGKLRGLSPHSINIHLRNARAFANWVGERDANYSPVKIREVKAPREREHDYLTREELTAVLAYLDGVTLNGQPVAPFIEFVALTGLRRGEALAFRRSWVRDGLIRIPATVSKTDITRFVPVTPRLAELLPVERWLGMTIEVSRIFRRAVRAAGIQRAIKFHNLRDTFIVQGIQSGVPLPILARIAGHDVRTMLANYAHFSEADFRAAGKTLGNSTKIQP